MFWLRQAGVLLVIGLAVLAYPGVLGTPERIWATYAELWQRRDAVLRDWRTERSGESLLSGTVQAMLSLLRDNRVETFRYSAAIASAPDASVVQRIAEGAYPIRLKPDAQHVLLLPTDRMDPGCKLVASRPEVLLAHCS